MHLEPFSPKIETVLSEHRSDNCTQIILTYCGCEKLEIQEGEWGHQIHIDDFQLIGLDVMFQVGYNKLILSDIHK